jgi:CheY-like chemotaxis protein
VKISVTDTGIGIPETNLQMIFDPYFTTKPQGNGLGLATCFSIVKKHGGKIRAASTVGAGSTFVISLPASEQECVTDSKSSTELLPGSGRVLVMDDDEDVRALTKGILEQLGYTAEFTVNGAEAAELYLKRKVEGRPFSATILDLTIPGGIGGKETIERLLKIDPAVKAIVSSGYSNDPVMANYRDYGFHAVLSKPYLPQEMSKVLLELTGS